MPVLVADPLPIELERLIERRRALGTDRCDEIWEGVLHMNPAPQLRHADLEMQLGALLRSPARAAGLRTVAGFNLGTKDDYRTPDVGLVAERQNALYLPTAALVVEILSPGDDTWEKLPFYAAHDVDELLIIDPDAQTADWRALSDRAVYEPIERSNLISLDPGELVAAIDWPPA